MRNNCPRCDSECTDLDSSREQQVSAVMCLDCDFGFNAPVDEDCIEKMWNLIGKESCAVMDEDDEYE